MCDSTQREIYDLFAEFVDDTLRSALDTYYVSSHAKEARAELLARTYTAILDAGIVYLCSNIESDSLEQFSKVIGFRRPSDGEASKIALELARHILKGSLSQTLEKCGAPLLLKMCVDMKLDSHEDRSDGASLRNQLCDEVLLTGTKFFLGKLGLPLLRSMCQELHVPDKASNKLFLVDAVMVKMFDLNPMKREELQEQESVEKERQNKCYFATNKPTLISRPEALLAELKKMQRTKKPTKDTHKDIKKEVKNSKKRASKELNGKEEEEEVDTNVGHWQGNKFVSAPTSTIKKGISKDDLHSNFNKGDLDKYCTENSIKKGKKKPETMRNILKWLESNPDGAASNGGGNKKRQRR
eukprot:TRINITY_DN617_c5_g1_i1.p1 TRINITY_DN617_c5_g1~~TRINITY_DN617_c5_g1_i1.p1  ORF type:complete len:376 (+),score=128.15 TRINITY_DN617_c5_g1_i1:65-1129(+)